MPNPKYQPDGSITLSIVIPWVDIAKEYEHQVSHAVEDTELPGFRKGKAPRDLVEPKLDKNTLYSRSIETLLPKIYSQTIKDLNLKPILYPQIKVTKGELHKDWEFEATTCEAPKVTLGDYQSKLKDIKTDKPEDRLATVLKVLTETSKVTLPQILITEEVNHRLAALTDNITHLGMTIDNYLSAKKTTADNLKTTIATEATADLNVEFILQEVGKQQKLTDRTKVLDFLKTL